MSGNALESMIVPVVRGVVVVVMLGAAAKGLMRMGGLIAAGVRGPDAPPSPSPAALAAREDAAGPDLLADEELAGAVA